MASKDGKSGELEETTVTKGRIVSDKEKLYLEFKDNYVKVHQAGTYQQLFSRAQTEWNSIKKSFKGKPDVEFVEEIQFKISVYKNQALQKKAKQDSMWESFTKAKQDSMWASFTSPKRSSKPTAPENPTEKPSTSPSKPSETQEEPPTPTPSIGKTKETPAQDEVKKLITVLESDLNALQNKLDSGLAVNPGVIRKLKEEKKMKLDEAKADLKKLQNNVVRQGKFRESQKRKLEVLKEKYPEETVSLGRSAPGRPRLEETQPGLLEAIKRIATSGGAADNRRRSEQIQSVKTLEDLTAKLEKEGFSLSEWYISETYPTKI